MAKAIKSEFSAETKLIEGGGGIFDVHVNGTQIWSKHQTGRFPEHGEVLDKLARMAVST